MFEKQNVLAGIVTYNPDRERLKLCVSSVSGQTGGTVIFDNGSEDTDIIDSLEAVYKGSVDIIRSSANKGIAFALASIMDYARQNGYAWVLSLDQDSVLTDNTVDNYLIRANDSRYTDAGMFTCLIKDRNFSDEKYEFQKESVIEVLFCITSGSFMNVEKYFKTDGYDESFFIDCVDFDICYNLRKNHYKIYRIDHPGLLHEVGRGENRRFLWRKIVVYNKKPERIFYLTRNTVWLYKKYSEYTLPLLIKTEMAILARIMLYEDSKREKLSEFVRGVKQSFILW